MCVCLVGFVDLVDLVDFVDLVYFVDFVYLVYFVDFVDLVGLVDKQREMYKARNARNVEREKGTHPLINPFTHLLFVWFLGRVTLSLQQILCEVYLVLVRVKGLYNAS